VLLAQLTDTHVVDPAVDHPDMLADNNRRLALAVERLNAETVQPEAVIATGDLTDTGSGIEIDLLVGLLAELRAPVLALPGNHDDRSTFRAAFDMPWATTDSHLSWAVDVGPLRVVGLDTLKPGTHGGLFDPERREWLADSLEAAGDRPVVIAMHHPPFLSGIHWMDTMHLEGMADFAEVVTTAQQGGTTVLRILCGHLHRPLTATVAGVTTTVAPSTIHHVELDLHPEARTEVILDPAGYHLHHLQDTEPNTWVSHIRYIDTGQLPVGPSWAD
jgi:3',5'-cyclic AMP phosphodiesterase CpdA